MSTADDLVEQELTRTRFVRLINELVRGFIPRHTFQPWEVAILLDLETHQLTPKARVDTLRRYQKAVEKQLEDGPGPPMTLSEFLQLSSTRRPRSDQDSDKIIPIASE